MVFFIRELSVEHNKAKTRGSQMKQKSLISTSRLTCLFEFLNNLEQGFRTFEIIYVSNQSSYHLVFKLHHIYLIIMFVILLIFPLVSLYIISTKNSQYYELG